MSAANATAPVKRSANKDGGQGRRNLFLAIIAVLQVGALVLVLLTVARPPTTKVGPLLGTGVTSADITAFTVTGPKGASVTLKRAGTNWVLPDLGNYPAKTARVKTFLDELVALHRSGLVATTKDAYKRLKVATDTYERKVALTLKDGKTETLYVGSEPSYGSTHVRMASDTGVYVTHSLHSTDARTDAAGYVDPTVLSLNESNVTRLEVKNGSGDFVFTKGSSGWSMQNVPSGKTFDPNSINTILSSLTKLQLDEPLGKTAKPAYGFAKPLAVVTLTTVSKPASSTSGAGAGKGAAATGTTTTGATTTGAAKTGAAKTGAAKTAGAGTTTATTGAGATTTKSGTAATGTAAAGAATTSTPAGKGSTSSTTSSTASTPAKPAKASAPPVTTTTTITIGAKDKAGFYPIRISSSPFIVRASDTSLGGVVGDKATDFYAKPKSSSSSNGIHGLGGVVNTPGGTPTGQ